MYCRVCRYRDVVICRTNPSAVDSGDGTNRCESPAAKTAKAITASTAAVMMPTVVMGFVTIEPPGEALEA